VDPKAVLDNVEKRKFLTLPGLELRSLGEFRYYKYIYLVQKRVH
jgi:hypothetical protein